MKNPSPYGLCCTQQIEMTAIKVEGNIDRPRGFLFGILLDSTFRRSVMIRYNEMDMTLLTSFCW